MSWAGVGTGRAAERGEAVREIKRDIKRQRQRSSESSKMIERKEGGEQEREWRESWIHFHFLSRVHLGEWRSGMAYSALTGA